MKDLDLTTLRLFVAVCDAQSIKRVAEREQLNASAITKRLANLEAQLQTPLLKRVRQGVQPTPEGALLSEHARRLLSDAQKITDRLLKNKSLLAGSITIASHMASMSSVLTDDLASFMLLHRDQGLQLKVKEVISKDVVQMVRDGHATFGVIWDNTETSGLQHVDYYSDTIAVVVDKKHTLASRSEISYAEIVVHDLIADKHTQHSESLLQRSGGISCEDARYAMLVEGNHNAIRLAAKGVGVYVCNSKIAQPYCDALQIVVVPLTDTWAKVRVKIVFKSNLLSPMAKELISHLVHQQR